MSVEYKTLQKVRDEVMRLWDKSNDFPYQTACSDVNKFISTEMEKIRDSNRG